MRCASRSLICLTPREIKEFFAALPREASQNIVAEPLYQTLDISSKLHGLEFRRRARTIWVERCDLGLVA